MEFKKAKLWLLGLHDGIRFAHSIFMCIEYGIEDLNKSYYSGLELGQKIRKLFTGN